MLKKSGLFFKGWRVKGAAFIRTIDRVVSKISHSGHLKVQLGENLKQSQMHVCASMFKKKITCK